MTMPDAVAPGVAPAPPEPVRLRPLQMSDLDHVMTWVNDPDIVGNFSTFSHPISREEEARYLEKLLGSENDKVFAIESLEGQYIGNIGIHQIHWPSRLGRLAIIIGNRGHWGKGYAQSALRQVIAWGFNQANLHKIWLIYFETNEKARHIYTKMGFVQEGVLRDEYFHYGRYHNMIRMSLLEHEYRALPWAVRPPQPA